jgi:hypothetical protein
MFGSTFTPCANRFGFNAPGAYPINFFLTNPFSAGTLQLTEDSGQTNYNGLQVNFRGRRGNGFTYGANYTWSHSFSNIWGDNANNDGPIKTIRNKSGDMAPSMFDQRHVFNFYSLYDLPFGRNKLINVTNPIVNGIVGGWKLSGILTVASGDAFRLGSARQTVNTNDAGIILAPGVTAAQIQQAMNVSPAKGVNMFFLPPSMIGPDGLLYHADHAGCLRKLPLPLRPEQLEHRFLTGKNHLADREMEAGRMVRSDKRAESPNLESRQPRDHVKHTKHDLWANDWRAGERSASNAGATHGDFLE